MVKMSVIVPVYNGEKYVNSCLRHLLSQTLKDIEIIVVDDGSQDKTVSKVKEFSDENIVLISQRNAGAGEARNTGIMHAKGKYIAFLDVDDQYTNDSTLELLFNKAEENNALVCGGGMINTDNKVMHSFAEERMYTFEENPFDFGFYCFIYHNSLFDDSSIYFPSYKVYEDPVFLLKVMCKARDYYVVKDITYRYSGTHHAVLNAEKTRDYLRGLTDNLKLTSKMKCSALHKVNYERLITSGSYYYEMNIGSGNKELFSALINANQAIDIELLKEEEIYLPDCYLIPALNTVITSAEKYNRLRKKLLFWKK